MKIKFLQKLLLGACALGTLAAPSCHAFEIRNDMEYPVKIAMTGRLVPPPEMTEEEKRSWIAFRDAQDPWELMGLNGGISEKAAFSLYMMFHTCDLPMCRIPGLAPGASFIGKFDESLPAALGAWMSPDAPEQIKSLRLHVIIAENSGLVQPRVLITRDNAIAQRLSDPEVLDRFFAVLRPFGQPQVEPTFDGGYSYEGHLKAV